MKIMLGLFIGTNGGDDCVHVNSEAGEIGQVLHGSNASDGCLSFCLVGISKIHNILGCSFHLVNQLAVNQTFFLWGRKADDSSEFASSLRLVTFSIVKFL